MMVKKQLLLIITGSIAAYKIPEFIRLCRQQNYDVRCILTKGGTQFVTPLTLAALSEQPVFTDIFSLKDETEMGHIRLSREADLVIVVPASADILAKMAHGMADDLASTVLLATDKTVMVAPAMNSKMWEHKATQRNISQLKEDGIIVIAPESGTLACGEEGTGRMAEPLALLSAIERFLSMPNALAGLSALVTSGPTRERIDPVRYITNDSSGKQGYAIAAALAERGANVTLISGITQLAAPPHVTRIIVESARDMLEACLKALPVDIAICAAAVADFRPEIQHSHKLKKTLADEVMELTLVKNPDILATLATPSPHRPKLVIGFAAETENLTENAHEKLQRKGCDWIIANNVSNDVFNAEDNQVTFISADTLEEWPRMSKQDVATQLVEAIHQFLS
jgi:phosphopantothenoylcysteine decarboxylase/phosphopantothenate--cysteine ligase